MIRILITGASRGIGRAIALRLASPETELLLQGRDSRALEGVAQTVRSLRSEGVTIAADLTTDAGIAQVVQSVGHAPVHVIIHNAGMAVVKPVEQIELAEWELQLRLNVTAPFRLTQQLLERIPTGGAIVHLLSVAAKTGFPGWGAYCMTKFALDGFAKSLREELRPRGIRIINIYPAATATEIWNNVPGSWDQSKMLRPERVADAVAFALAQPADTLVDEISLGGLSGNL